MAELQNWNRQVLPSGSLLAPEVPSLAEAFTSGLGDLLKAAVPVAQEIARADELRRSRSDSATIAVKKPEAALAYRRIYADAAASAAEGTSDFVEQIQLSTAEYNARMMASLPENLRGPMLSYLEDLQISTVRSAEQFQAASDIALRARRANDAAAAWTELAKDNSEMLPQIRAQIRDFVAGQQLDPSAGERFEQALVDSVVGTALFYEAATKPEQFLANKGSDRWQGVSAERLAVASAQASQVLELKKRQETAEAATRAVGLKTRVRYAIDLYNSGTDFPGYASLAQTLRAAGESGLLESLDESRSDLGYAAAQQSSTPELLEKSRNSNLQRAEAAQDPMLAKMYRRHAAIDGATLDAVTGGAQRDPLAFAERAKVVAPTDVLTPIFETASTDDVSALQAAVGDRNAAREQVQNHYSVPVGFLTLPERQKFVSAYAALPNTEAKVSVLRALTKLPQDVGTEIGKEVAPIAGGDQIPLALGIMRRDPGLVYDLVYGADIVKRFPTIIPDKRARFEWALNKLFEQNPAADPEQERAERTAIANVYAATLYSIRGASKMVNVRGDLLELAFARVRRGRAPPSDRQ